MTTDAPKSTTDRDLTDEPSDEDVDKTLVVIFLVAGFGTRIKKDLIDDPQFSYLSHIPKPLLPLAGLPILSHWLPLIAELPTLCGVILITNDAHRPLYDEWLEHLPLQLRDAVGNITILTNDATDNHTRHGAVQDLSFALLSADDKHIRAKTALVVAGDTLLPSVDLGKHVAVFEQQSDQQLAVFSYQLTDMSDCVRRGMLAVRRDNEHSDVLVATALVEKPTTPALAPSPWATAPVYIIRRTLWVEANRFLYERRDAPLAERDAPGHFLSWLLRKEECRMLCVPGRIDIGRLSHYKDALVHYTTYPQPPPTPCYTGEPAIGRAFPRIGLLGNPSDMYAGKVVAVAIASEGYAEVVACPAPEFSVMRNMDHELPSTFVSMQQFTDTIASFGVNYGAGRLVLVAAYAFIRKFTAHGGEPIGRLPLCRLSYSTSIPERIGLSGSSALILATWRALARFYNTTLENVDPDRTAWPVLLRDIEKDELGISCGLMDRVVQVMQGCVAMDFTKGLPGVWEWLPEDALPQLYIAHHSVGGGECSGVMHARTKKYRRMDDRSVEEIATALAGIAEQGAQLLLRKKEDKTTDMALFSELFKRNFDLRCALLGRETVGEANVRLIEVAHEAGFTAKLTGSGGCVVCVPKSVCSLTGKQESEAKSHFDREGMQFRRVEVLKRIPWQP